MDVCSSGGLLFLSFFLEPVTFRSFLLSLLDSSRKLSSNNILHGISLETCSSTTRQNCLNLMILWLGNSFMQQQHPQPPEGKKTLLHFCSSFLQENLTFPVQFLFASLTNNSSSSPPHESSCPRARNSKSLQTRKLQNPPTHTTSRKQKTPALRQHFSSRIVPSFLSTAMSFCFTN